MKKRIDEGDKTYNKNVDNSDMTQPLYPTNLDMITLFGLFITCLYGAKFLVAPLLFTLFDSSAVGSNNAGAVMLFSQLMAFIPTILFMFIMRKRRGNEPIKVKFSVKGFDPVIILSGLVMMFAVSIIIEPLLALVPSVRPNLSGGGFLMLLSVVVVAPIFEEYICRGLLLESLRSTRGVVLAWIISSLFFAMMHLDGVLSLNAFFMGLILGYIYISSGSLFAPIILHAINNAFAYLFFAIGKDGMMLRDLVANNYIYYIMYALSIVVFVIAKIKYTRRFKEIIAKEETGFDDDVAKDNI